MHKNWCGNPCSECENPCALDESIPCSPDCDCLGENGETTCDECEYCDAICQSVNEINNYSNFCRYYDDHDDEFEVILDYDDFQVIKHIETDSYFYLEKSENDADEFYELELCAVLRYDICHDLLLDPDDAGVTMSCLFECDCCGERITDDFIEYLWFKQI